MDRSQQGLTLVELMVTLGVFSVIVAAGVPAYSEARTRSELRAVTGELVAALRWARSEAIRTNQSTTVAFGPGALCADGSAAVWAVRLATAVLKCSPAADYAARFPKTNAPTAQQVTFNSRGLANAPVVAYAVSSKLGGNNRLITVERNGRILEAG